MYTLKLFYRHGSQFTAYADDPDALTESGEQAQKQGLIFAWRVVNVENGKCWDYWKEGETPNARAYEL